mgnify:CR=1 FL=1
MILEDLAAGTKARIEQQKQKIPLKQLQKQAEAMGRESGFSLYQALKAEGMSFICEVKRASPSKGVIAESFPYLEIAREYEAAGASAVSVLTEPERFLGRDEYLSEIAGRVKLPVLRKDFTIDPYMIYQAKVLGASAVLLICRILSRKQTKEYLKLTHELGMSALVEVHTEKEVDQALEAGAEIIGVNNRNLQDFTVDVSNSLRLRAIVPPSAVFVAESGIKNREDIRVLEENGVDAVLVGEVLMRSRDKKERLNQLKGRVS